jgi:hypothetical protein
MEVKNTLVKQSNAYYPVKNIPVGSRIGKMFGMGSPLIEDVNVHISETGVIISNKTIRVTAIFKT